LIDGINNLTFNSNLVFDKPRDIQISDMYQKKSRETHMSFHTF
jgi:hypothetical protein